MGADAFGAVIAPRCPVTGGLPTRMTETAFRAACEAKSGTDTRDWRYKRCKDQPPKPPRCRQCDGRRDNWPAELAITQEGEPMSTTKTKTTTKPATKKPAPIPAPTCTCADDLPHAHALANQLREIESILEQEAVPHDAPVADQVRELIAVLHDATDKLAATLGVLSHFGEGRDPVRLAQNAVSCCRDLEEQVKAQRPADPRRPGITSTILSGRGEIHVVIRPYTPASTPTEADA